MPLSIPVAQRDANSASLADDAAESLLCRVAHANGYRMTDEQFAQAQTQLRDLLAQQLYQLDMRLQLDDTPAPTTYTHCTVRYRGRPTTARRVELLPNGYWRADLAGSGLVALYDEDPVANPGAHQRS